ncbi:MAG TPA: YeeE/YedE thiosulfate transporter family protein [Bdellovibrionales bacterium]|nr:YeeE/YedE thiosulfate transporter family protein [Bdellovibrionales bacterium]
MHPWLMSLLGGSLIGVAASLMLIANGRVTGISGIYSGLLGFNRADFSWRLAFVVGLISGAFVFWLIKPELFHNLSGRPIGVLAIGGLLVGFGTVIGSGCTSGHGVCGISRLSVRSVVATMIFMAAGVVTATWFFKTFGGLT